MNDKDNIEKFGYFNVDVNILSPFIYNGMTMISTLPIATYLLDQYWPAEGKTVVRFTSLYSSV